MIPDFVASDDVPRKLTRNNPGGPITPTATWQPSLPHDGTIDPSLLMVENHELLSQHNSSSIPPHTSGDGHSQHLAPAFPASTEVWVVYPGDQPSTSALSPISPTVGNWVSPLEVWLCCADGSSPRVPSLPRLWTPAFAAVAAVSVSHNGNTTDKGPTLFVNKNWKR
jgi:hypothetical protein